MSEKMSKAKGNKNNLKLEGWKEKKQSVLDKQTYVKGYWVYLQSYSRGVWGVSQGSLYIVVFVRNQNEK